MAGTPIIPKGSPPPLAPYSPGTRAGNAIYVSGTLALDGKGKTVGVGDAGAQTRQVLENIKAVLAAGGATMADVVYNMIFLKDLADYAAMNAVYKDYFPTNPPARYCIRADLVKPEFLVEIATIAHLEGGRGRATSAPRARTTARSGARGTGARNATARKAAPARKAPARKGSTGGAKAGGRKAAAKPRGRK